MGDMAEDFRALKAFRQEKRRDNTNQSTAYLAGLGIPFESKNNGAHLIVDSRVDFWPSTGLWITRGPSGQRGRGVRHLLQYLKNSETNSEPCLDCEQKGTYPSGAICKSCGGTCRVPKGTNKGVIASE